MQSEEEYYLERAAEAHHQEQMEIRDLLEQAQLLGYVAIPLTQVEAMLREAVRFGPDWYFAGQLEKHMDEWIQNKIKEARQ